MPADARRTALLPVRTQDYRGKCNAPSAFLPGVVVVVRQSVVICPKYESVLLRPGLGSFRARFAYVRVIRLWILIEHV